jgi:MFS family permease
MTFSPTAALMITAQALCGASASVIVPSLVALIAENYRGRQQATAVGVLGSARAAAGVLAFVIGGILGTYIGWRPVFGILIAVSAIVFLLSFRLKVDQGRPDVAIDGVGVALAAAAIVLISFGFNNLNGWGLVLATANAPFNLLGLSPAPIFIIVGLVLGQAFLRWTHRRQETGRTPLLALEVLDSREERAAVYAMFSVVALEAALNFTVPLYIQIVQGRTPIATAVAMMPFNLTVFFAAMLIVKLYDRLTPRQIGRYGFILCTVSLVWLAFVVHNDWSEVPVLFGLVLFGIGQGSLVTLVFNVLVTASPKELAGDVGALRGTTQNLASAVGTAVAGALMVGLLSAIALGSIAASPKLTSELEAQLDLDNINFISNDHLQQVLAGTTATPAQVAELVRLNTEARLRALKIGLLVMAGLAFLTIIPAGRLPDYRPGELPDPEAENRKSPSQPVSQRA